MNLPAPLAAGAHVEIAPDLPDDSAWFADNIASAIYNLAKTLGRPPLVALSGGATPGPIYEKLASPALNLVGRTLWCQVDERDVPPDHPDSNQGMICRTLFGVPPAAPPDNFLAVPLPSTDPGLTARAYSHLLSRHIPAGSSSIDLALLGIGTDGHTASLFPTANWREIPAYLFGYIDAPAPTGRRYTLTLQAILAAKRCVFIVKGAAKAAIVRRILRDAPGDLPAGAVVRAAETTWLLDREAAAHL